MAVEIEHYEEALSAGVSSVKAWAGLLDRINVFPVADGDTGRNMVTSLAPLEGEIESRQDVVKQMLYCARGNSGNIAAQFFSGLLAEEGLPDLLKGVRLGRERAWKAVPDPVSGTMLSLFDTLEESLEKADVASESGWSDKVLADLAERMMKGMDEVPVLKEAGVIDAGALGMYVFLEGFFKTLEKRREDRDFVAERFGEFLQIDPEWSRQEGHGFCVDMVFQGSGSTENLLAEAGKLGESVVAISHDDIVKLHLHTDDLDGVRGALGKLGDVVRFESDDLMNQTSDFKSMQNPEAIRVMTDGAGTLSIDEAIRLNISLLDSYVSVGSESIPESRVVPSALYVAMKKGIKVSTSQASKAERHEKYERALERYGRVLYLCVGSVYTGNYDVVMEWKRENDPEDRLVVIDTGAASGRLGIISRETARYSLKADDPEEVINYARRLVDRADELIFLGKLHYLAAGGRLSKTAAFFGDAFRFKPVVRPTPQGVEKVTVLRNRTKQKEFALNHLGEVLKPEESAVIMVEYTDNQDWLAEEVEPRIKEMFPKAEVISRPMSKTSGAHMGPGTWAVAFLPEISSEEDASPEKQDGEQS